MWKTGGFRLILATASVLLLLVAGCGSGDSQDEEAKADASSAQRTAERAASEKYEWYLERKAKLAVDWTKQLWGQIVAGEVEKAQSRYATSRVQYSQLLPAPMLFPALEKRINGQLAEQDGAFTGFHRIEQGLFGAGTTAGLKPVAKALVEDLQRLNGEMKSMSPAPALLAKAGVKLLEETAAGKLAGEEEPYSEVDLVDVSASVEGAEAAFQVLRPLLTGGDPDLVLQIEARFAEVYERLSELGSPGRQPQARDPAAGAIFVGLGEVDEETVRELTAAVRRLADSFAEGADLVSAS